MKNLAIIPARSGSKGLKDKNIKQLNGKPLMAYSIEAAIRSGKFDEVMVSTDSVEYANVARQYGASVPFLRSAENATDKASSWDMVSEVLDRYRMLNREFDSFCLLQPTSPFRNAEDIIEAYKLFETKASVAVVSVCEVEHSPLWSGSLPEDNSLNGFINKDNNKPRQEFEKIYSLNGAIYIVNILEFKKDIDLYRKGSYAYIMDRNRSVDIDTEQDFLFAEFLSQRK